MKRIICLITTLCLVLGSFSFAFAQDWSATDSNNLAYIKASVMSGGQLYNVVNSCNTVLNNINYNLVTLMGWLDPANGGGTNAILNQILTALTYTDAGGLVKSFISDIWQVNSLSKDFLQYIAYGTANSRFNTTSGNWSDSTWRNFSHIYLGTLWNGSAEPNSFYTVPVISGPGQSGLNGIRWDDGTPIGNLAVLLWALNHNTMYSYTTRWSADLTGYDSLQTGLSWRDIEQSVTFTPTSSTNGIYNWLKNIQAPVARLSYVLASDERIEAQEAAAANEQAVVDNFIDSSGSGATSVSDIGSISDLSAGYQNNFGSSASVTGIFNIFDSNNFGWFSQETANQLDTSSNNSRARSGSEFDTPLLDQKINDIYDALGVKP